MDINEKLINNIITFFSESKVIKQFKDLFLEELKNNPKFQEKLNEMIISDGLAPGDEILWKKIIEADVGRRIENLIKSRILRTAKLQKQYWSIKQTFHKGRIWTYKAFNGLMKNPLTAGFFSGKDHSSDRK